MSRFPRGRRAVSAAAELCVRLSLSLSVRNSLPGAVGRTSRPSAAVARRFPPRSPASSWDAALVSGRRLLHSRSLGAAFGESRRLRGRSRRCLAVQGRGPGRQVPRLQPHVRNASGCLSVCLCVTEWGPQLRTTYCTSSGVFIVSNPSQRTLAPPPPK